mgnify:CR=1 FL=1
MHTGLSEEQRRQIEKMRRQSGRMPVYRKTAEKVNDFSEKTEELPQNGSSLALFLQFHLSGSSIFGYNSREAVTAVSQSIDLQKVADSVRIK